MRLFLDEDLASALHVRLLKKAGHDVSTPTDAGTLGKSDVVQLALAVHENRACLSRNYKDYEELHFLIDETNGRHCGILIVRRENDPKRDLTAKGIVTAIRKLEASGAPVENEYIVLNHWR